MGSPRGSSTRQDSINEVICGILILVSFFLQFDNWQTPDCPVVAEKLGKWALKYLDKGVDAMKVYMRDYMGDEFKPTMERHLSSATE